MEGSTYNQRLNTPENNNFTGGNRTPNSAGFDWGGVGLSSITAVTSLLSVGATLADMENENQAIKDSMESAVESSLYKQNLQGEQIRDLERITGDKLTASGLEELKAESRLKASAAETGATGTSNTEAVATSGMNKLHRDAVIQRDGEIAVKNAMNAMTSEALNLDNQLTMMASRTASPLKGFLATMNAGVSGFNNGLSYMSSADKQKLFNIEPSYRKA